MSLLEQLRSSEVLLMDGAMGTELLRRWPASPTNLALLTEEQLLRVQAVHESYVQAGSRCLVTATFPVNTFTVAPPGSLGTVVQCFERGVELARLAAAGSCLVLTSIGPVLPPGSAQELAEPMSLQASTRGSYAADGLLLETWSSPEAFQALQIVREITTQPVLVALAFRKDPAGKLLTHSGHSPEAIAALAEQHQVDALGINCGRDIGISEVLEIVRRYRRATDRPLFARPNAGTPRQVGGQWVYPLAPADLADQAKGLLQEGVALLGGCCGTTPEHIAALRPVVETWNARRCGR